MDSKILILSHKKLTNSLLSVIDTLPPPSSTIVIRDIGFGGIENFIQQQLPEIQPNVIVTGGAHWEMLKQSDIQLPVPLVSIPITRYDLLSAVVKAQTFSNKIAIIHYGNQLVGLESVLTNFNADVHFFRYTTNKEVFSICDQLKKQGFGVVVGAGYVCEVSESFYLPSVFLHSVDSIEKVLSHVIKMEEARSEMLHVANKWSMEFMHNPILIHDSFSLPEPKKLPSTLQISTLGQQIIEDSTHWSADSYKFYTIAKFSLLQPINTREFITATQSLHVHATVYTTEHYMYAFMRANHQEFIKCFTPYFNKIKKCGIAPILSAKLESATIEQLLQESNIAYNLAKVGHLEAFTPTNPYTLIYTLYQKDALPEITHLNPLLSQRNHERLIDTLELLLDHGLSITTVSNYLTISRQTVYTIMKRIEELVGLLSDVNNRFLLSFELRIFRLQQALTKTVAQAELKSNF